ncbi:MAG: hypothetical protein ACLUQW_06030 [Collinsella sp.]
MLKKTLAFALSAALFAFSLAGCGGNSIDSAKASDADSGKTEQAADAPEGASAAPITADKVADGTYPITVDSSSNMFRIVDAQLIVENGSMHCVMTLSGTGYGKLFMGTGDEAAAASEADFIPMWKTRKASTPTTCPLKRSTRTPPAPRGVLEKSSGTTARSCSNPPASICAPTH